MRSAHMRRVIKLSVCRKRLLQWNLMDVVEDRMVLRNKTTETSVMSNASPVGTELVP